MKRLLLVLIVVSLGLAGAAYWISRNQNAAASEDLFKLGGVKYGPMKEVVSGSGVIQPTNVVIVASQVEDRVVEINADYNDTVTPGQVLLRLDDSKAQGNLNRATYAVEQALAGVVAAKADLQRAQAQRDAADTNVKRLEAQDSSLRNDFELTGARELLKAAKAQVETAQALVMVAELKEKDAAEVQRLARIALDKTIIRVPAVGHKGPSAPRPGLGFVVPDTEASAGQRTYTVLDRKVVLNQPVSPQLPQPLFTLVADLAQLQLLAQIAEGDVAKVRKGDPAEVTPSAFSEAGKPALEGKVTDIRLSPGGQLGAVFYTAVIDVANPRDERGVWQLRPGMTASVNITYRTRDNAWKMPSGAINFALDEQYQSEAAKAKLANFRKDRKDGDHWEPVWVLDREKKPWPMFVRVKENDGRASTRETEYREVLEWDPEFQPPPDAAKPGTYPYVIIEAKPPSKPGLFNKIKINF